MGLLDKFKDKAADLAQGAKDRVSDATGIDTDKLIDGPAASRTAWRASPTPPTR